DRADILVRPPPARPERVLAMRALLVLGLFLLVMGVCWWDRAGLRDQFDGEISPSDVVYFTMVTVTTVGYGDIVPVTARARLIDALVITPIRLFVWFIFLGTAYEFLIQRSIEDLRMLRLQRQLNNHVVICGYGGAGHHAAAELVRMGRPASEVVIIDVDRGAADRAAAAGFTALHGTATREEILEIAAVSKAAAIIVSVDSDDTTALIVLTARELSKARILAKVIEPENIKLMRRSGADQIISLGALGGSLLADGVNSDLTLAFVDDLVSRQGRVHLTQRKPLRDEVGRAPMSVAGLVMVRRAGGQPLSGDDLRDLRLDAADEMLCISYTSGAAAAT
ncbi:MAG: potassium channel family protein, partial [Pseudomonadales bacterium]|nr:potassium channel family protein [Pseudomonadales bacterium]